MQYIRNSFFSYRLKSTTKQRANSNSKFQIYFQLEISEWVREWLYEYTNE